MPSLCRSRIPHTPCGLPGIASRVRALCFLALAVGFGSPAALGGTYFVDSGAADDSGNGLTWGTAKKSLGAALAASAPGDTVLVRYGLYPLSAALAVSSDRKITSDDGTHETWNDASPDANRCALSGGNLVRVLTITGSVTSATEIRGFGVTQGNADPATPDATYGGGIYVGGGADPVIESCRVYGNVAGPSFNGYGGGIACVGSGTNPVVRDCIITGNLAAHGWCGFGGGIFCGSGTAPTIENNSIDHNTASVPRIGQGGGIYCGSSNAQILDNDILANVAASALAGAGGSGGGVYVFQGMVHIEGNNIGRNYAGEATWMGGAGGGVFIQSNDGGSVLRNRIWGNVAAGGGSGDGGGVYCGVNHGDFEGNRIHDNIASAATCNDDYYRTGHGGGIYAVDAAPQTIRDNDVYGNVGSVNGPGYGGGIYANSVQTVDFNRIYLNVASSLNSGRGGGAWTSGRYIKLRNNTFFRNADRLGPDGGHGSGLYHDSGTDLVVTNCVFSNHDLPPSDGMGIYSAVPITIHYNSFYGNPGGDYNANVTSLDERGGSPRPQPGSDRAAPLAFDRGSDPRFNDPEHGDFSLRYDSPLIEAGDSNSTVPENGGWRIDIGALEYTGTSNWKSVSGPGELLFGGQAKAKVNFTDAGTVTAVCVTSHPGEPHPQMPGGVARWFEVEPTGGGATFDLTLTWLDDELQGEIETDLYLWYWTGTEWDGPIVASMLDPVNNVITATGLTQFGQWALADDPSSAVGNAGGSHPPRSLSVGPNPFRSETWLRFRSAGEETCFISIFTPEGRMVRNLFRGEGVRGSACLRWDGLDESGRRVPAGMYYARLWSRSRRESKALTLIR